MKTTVKTMAPQEASQILETRNPRNRPMSLSFVDKLARDIINGMWILHHQGIAFDVNGDLIDGQHRLAAIAKAGKSVQIMVTTGVPAETRVNGISLNTFETIDTGRGRSVGQMLTMCGIPNANLVAGATRAIVNLSMRTNAYISLSTSQTHKAISYLGGSVQRCCSIASAKRIIKPKSACIAVLSFYHTVKPTEAESFLRELSEVSGGAKSQSRMLANWLSSHTDSGYAGTMATMKLTATAIWNHATGRNTEKLYVNENGIEWMMAQNAKVAANLRSVIKL